MKNEDLQKLKSLKNYDEIINFAKNFNLDFNEHELTNDDISIEIWIDYSWVISFYFNCKKEYIEFCELSI